jgi:carboxymethylenebutenolidase
MMAADRAGHRLPLGRAPDRAQEERMAGEMITVTGADGVTVDGYLTTPEAAGPAPAVVVIQEWWGLVDHIKDVADRFAREGFVALAPDLYHGQTAGEPDEANKLMMDMRREDALRELNAAIAYLAADARTNGKVGTIGFCLGGGLSLLAACSNPTVAACVDFYGVLPGGQPDCDQLKAPVLGIFGASDPWMPPDAVRQLEEGLRASGKRIETVIYPERDHAFFNETNSGGYHAADAADAWRRTLAFFNQHLRG